MRSLACLGVLCLVQSLDFSSRAGIKFSVIGQWSTTSTKCGLVIVPDLHGEGVVVPQLATVLSKAPDTDIIGLAFSLWVGGEGDSPHPPH